jgi:hypothetical protein
VLIIYSNLNWFTMKNQYLLPLILRLLNQLNHAKMYTKINLDGTYNLVCIQKDNEWKICSKHVMAILNISWSPWPYKCTYKFAIYHEWCLLRIPIWFHVYCINKILIFFKNMEDHEWHVHLVLKKSKEVKIYTKLERCEFH